MTPGNTSTPGNSSALGSLHTSSELSNGSQANPPAKSKTVSMAQASIDELVTRLQTPEAHDGDRLKAARLCRQIDRLRDADDYFAELLEHHPNMPWLWLEAGQLSDKLGEAEQAAARYRQAAEDRGPIGQDALHALGLACLHADDVAQAGRAFFRLTRRNPGRPEGWAGMIVCATLARRPKLLVKARMSLAERFDADERTTSLCRVWLYAASVDATEEVNHLLKPFQTEAKAEGSTSNLAAGATPREYKQLVDWSTKVLKNEINQHPERADTHYHLAMCQNYLDQKPQSLQSAQVAVSINPRYQKALTLVNGLQDEANRSTHDKPQEPIHRAAA